VHILPTVTSPVNWRIPHTMLTGKDLDQLAQDPAGIALAAADFYLGRTLLTRPGVGRIYTLFPALSTTDFWDAVRLTRTQRLAVERGEWSLHEAKLNGTSFSWAA
jgi:hypothetical protein